MSDYLSPLISVVIPCYNQGKYLDEAVDSVLNQTYENIEIIIVNDGSTDEFTNELLSAYERPKTRVVHTENQGLAEARNVGIRNAKGKYILPLDADDKVAERYCEDAVGVLEGDKGIGIVYCEAEYFGDKQGKINLPDYSLKNILTRNIIFCTAFFRYEDWKNTAGYDPKMKYGNEDWDFWLSLIEKGVTIYKIPKTYFFYRIKSSSMLKDLVRDQEKRYYTRKQVFLNHTELYLQYFEDPLNLYHKAKLAERQLNRIKKSYAYRVGYLLTAPFKFLKK